MKERKLSFYCDNKNFPSKKDESIEIITSHTFLDLETHKQNIQKTKLTKRWTDDESMKFYKLLSLCGSDLSLIENCFSSKNRKQIKMKFKKEIKKNKKDVYEILNNSKFNVKEYEKYLI